MTTPGSHNDVYAGTCHRMFFANYVNGKDPKKCADNDGHNVGCWNGMQWLCVMCMRGGLCLLWGWGALAAPLFPIGR